MDIRPLSISDHEADDDRLESYKKVIKTFRVDPRQRHQSVPVHRRRNRQRDSDDDDSDDEKDGIRSKEQDDIKAIVLGQHKRDRGRGKYERDYNATNGRAFPLKQNKYRRKSLQFTIENRTDSDEDHTSDLPKRKNRKNLFFDSPGEDGPSDAEDFTMD
jgi:hypothetical protein